MEKLTMTVEEAGRALGLSRNSAYEAAKTGAIPTLIIGRRILVPIIQLENLIAGTDVTGAEPARLKNDFKEALRGASGEAEPMPAGTEA